MPPLVLAATAPWPVLAVGVVAVTGLCLWLLFRTGSIGDRARADDPADDPSDDAGRGPRPPGEAEPGRASDDDGRGGSR